MFLGAREKLMLDVFLKLYVLSLVFLAEFLDIQHDHIVLLEITTCSQAKIERSVVKTRSIPSGVAKSLLMFYLVEHTSALVRAVVRNPLAVSTGLSNRLGRSNRHGHEECRKLRFTASGGTPSGIMRLGLS
jgi:hypothetical protein